VVGQAFGRFRGCYATALQKNPALTGRVVARFVIAQNGSVSGSQRLDADLPDAAVTACVVSAFRSLSFPALERVNPVVDYGFSFSLE
jgi:hypothetical protein